MWEVGEGTVAQLAQDLLAAMIDEEDRPAMRPPERIARQGVTPFRRIAGGAENCQAFRIEERA
jgi:hypothetical protein